MYPVKFPEAYEQPLGAGDNPNTIDLPYRVARDPQTPGLVMLVSCWELSPEERAEVAKTGRVYVAVMAHPEYRTQPPVSLHGFNPFTDYPQGLCYKPAPRTREEEQVEEIIEEANRLKDLDRLKGIGRREDFEVEKKGNDFEVKTPGKRD